MAREPSRDRNRKSGLPREASALLLAGFSIFVLLSLTMSQATGVVGRTLAGPLRLVFGATAYLIPATGILISVTVMRNRPRPSPVRWGGLIGMLVSASILLELMNFANPRALGGMFGEFLGHVLQENFGKGGTYCLLLPVFLFCALASSSTSIREAVQRLTDSARAWQRRWRDRVEAQRSEKPAEVARSSRTVRENLKRSRTETDTPPPILIAERAKPQPRTAKARKPAQETFPFVGAFHLPSPLHLDPPVHLSSSIDEASLIASSRILESKLADFGVQGKVTAVRPGPVITTFEFEPAPGVKVNRIVTLADDLSMALRAMSVRILAPIPGKSVVGIEVSNPKREKVFLREILESDEFQGSPSKLTVALGKDSVGKPVVADLARMPHLLVAGATGTGKSVSLNAMIMSILYKATPDEVRFLMIDPKMLELSLYESVPHLLTRVVIDPREASAALARAVIEMENRYKLLRDKGVRNIDSYNRGLEREAEEKTAGVIELKDAEPVDPSDGWKLGESAKTETLVHRRLPYLLIVIDELADLMLTSGREVEEQITRLAQKARAAGIHLIVATQRPSVDVITGLIKANFPARISFQVTSRIDSRTILDSIGAERLLGDGDML